jgi:hypothetical protein
MLVAKDFSISNIEQWVGLGYVKPSVKASYNAFNSISSSG